MNVRNGVWILGAAVLPGVKSTGPRVGEMVSGPSKAPAPLGSVRGMCLAPMLPVSAGWQMPLVAWQLEDGAGGVCFCSF